MLNIRELKEEQSSSGALLSYTLTEDDVLDTVALRMLSNNPMKGLLPVVYTQIGTGRILRYHLSGLTCAAALHQETMGRKDILRFIKSLCVTISELPDYLLNPSMVSLQLSQIYIDDHGEAVLLYLPLEDARKDTRVSPFLREFVSGVRYASGEDHSYITQILSALNNAEFRLDDFIRLLERLSLDVAVPKRTVAQPAPESPQRSGQTEPVTQQPLTPAPPAASPVVQPKEKGGLLEKLFGKKEKDAAKPVPAKKEPKLKKESRQKPEKKKKEKTASSLGFAVPGQDHARPIQQQAPASQEHHVPSQNVFTNGFEEEEGTVILTDAPHTAAKVQLVRTKTQERIMLTHSGFTIGRKNSDYCISDNRAVSSRHLTLIERSGSWFVKDDGGKNGTFVNQSQVPNGGELPIYQTDKLLVADEEFIFQSQATF